eukprot:6172414-Amphidinium_carterae.1
MTDRPNTCSMQGNARGHPPRRTRIKTEMQRDQSASLSKQRLGSFFLKSSFFRVFFAHFKLMGHFANASVGLILGRHRSIRNVCAIEDVTLLMYMNSQPIVDWLPEQVQIKLCAKVQTTSPAK